MVVYIVCFVQYTPTSVSLLKHSSSSTINWIYSNPFYELWVFTDLTRYWQMGEILQRPSHSVVQMNESVNVSKSTQKQPRCFSHSQNDSVFWGINSLQHCPCRLSGVNKRSTPHNKQTPHQFYRCNHQHSYLLQSAPIHHLIYLITSPGHCCHSLVTFQQNTCIQWDRTKWGNCAQSDCCTQTQTDTGWGALTGHH